MRDVFPTKYYSKEGFIERKIEINEEDLQKIVEEYLINHTDFDFDEIEVINNRPINIWLHAKCRTYVEPDNDEEISNADIEIKGDYDGNPLSGF